MTAPAVSSENHRIKSNLADERSDFQSHDGDLTAWAVHFELDLLALQGLLEHWIRFGFRGLGNIFVIGGLVGENLVSDTFQSGSIAISEVEDDGEQG
jgi:hypothetical protein